MNTCFFFIYIYTKPVLYISSFGSVFMRMLKSTKVFATIVIEPNVRATIFTKDNGFDYLLDY